MKTPQKEAAPQRGLRGWRRWRGDDCPDNAQRPSGLKIGPDRPNGTIMRSRPEAHVYLETGDVVLGASRHTGATFRSGKPHRHGSDPDTGERLHIRMPTACPAAENDGKKRARKAVKGRRHARRDYRDDPHSR